MAPPFHYNAARICLGPHPSTGSESNEPREYYHGESSPTNESCIPNGSGQRGSESDVAPLCPAGRWKEEYRTSMLPQARNHWPRINQCAPRELGRLLSTGNLSHAPLKIATVKRNLGTKGATVLGTSQERPGTCIRSRMLLLIHVLHERREFDSLAPGSGECRIVVED